MEQGLAVVDRQRHHWQLQAPGREIAIGQAHLLKGLDPGLLQPGQVGAVPHHACMVGVLGQHAAPQAPNPFHYGLFAIHWRHQKQP